MFNHNVNVTFFCFVFLELTSTRMLANNEDREGKHKCRRFITGISIPHVKSLVRMHPIQQKSKKSGNFIIITIIIWHGV